VIYFIHNEGQGAVKIGLADDPERRYRALQTANSNTLVLLGSIPGDGLAERRLHRKYRALRIRGEWFKATDDLLGDIRGLIESENTPFMRLCVREPGLTDLLDEARSHRAHARFCANAVWYGYAGFKGRGIKARLCRLVGWYAVSGDPELRGKEAYDVAYRTIYDALPDCRSGCACQAILHALMG
jgi:hypothetical protein